MTAALPEGTEEYSSDSAAVVARGVSYTDAEIDDALSSRLLELIWDEAGKEEVAEVLTASAQTDFAQDGLAEILDLEPSLESWRVGEAFAEAFLVDHRSCEFPWPTGRDLKNPSASPAGCDLVGFHQSEDGWRLAFGEAKTSADTNYPPSVMYGRHGMVAQLEALKTSKEVKAYLVRYLAFRANGRPWLATFQEAAGRFLRDDRDVSLFGVLVRDVAPQDGDLKARAKHLATDLEPTSIELRAIYLPKGDIPKLPELAAQAKSSS